MTIDVYDKQERKYYKFSCPADAYAFVNEDPKNREIRNHLNGLKLFLDMLGVSHQR